MGEQEGALKEPGNRKFAKLEWRSAGSAVSAKNLAADGRVPVCSAWRWNCGLQLQRGLDLRKLTSDGPGSDTAEYSGRGIRELSQETSLFLSMYLSLPKCS